MHFINPFSAAVVALSTFIPNVAAIPTGHLEARYTMPNLDRLKSMMPQSPMGNLEGPGSATLKFVGLGIGTQNYTCTDGVLSTSGAVATVYDLGTRLNADRNAKAKISSISGLALAFHYTPELRKKYLKSQGYQQVLGDHFFTEKTPTFALNQVPANPFPLLYVGKHGEVEAPKSACRGLKNEGAIKWLLLKDNGNSKGGVNTVYRLETAGGAGSCAGGKKGNFQVPYVAQYWVY